MNRAPARLAAPRTRTVTPAAGDYVVKVTWQDGSASLVDLTALIFRLKHFRPLRNQRRFNTVAVADFGWAISWGGDLDVSGETLWELAQQQSAIVCSPSEFRAWLKRTRLTQAEAAEVLGVSKRSVAYYATGAQPVPRLMALAMAAVEGKPVVAGLAAELERLRLAKGLSLKDLGGPEQED